MDDIKCFPKFVKKLFHEHDISELNININKTQVHIMMVTDMYRDKSMFEISKEVGLEKSSFTRSVKYLVKKGFLEKNHSEEDRRIVNLSFTRKGNEALTQIKNHWNNYFNSLLSPFSKKEKEEFFDSIKTVSKYMNRIIAGDDK